MSDYLLNLAVTLLVVLLMGLAIGYQLGAYVAARTLHIGPKEPIWPKVFEGECDKCGAAVAATFRKGQESIAYPIFGQNPPEGDAA